MKAYVLNWQYRLQQVHELVGLILTFVSAPYLINAVISSFINYEHYYMTHYPSIYASKQFIAYLHYRSRFQKDFFLL